MAIFKIEQIIANKDVDIEELGLSFRDLECLKRNNVNKIGDLFNMNKNDLHELEAAGDLSIQHIEERLYTYIEEKERRSTESSENSDYYTNPNRYSIRDDAADEVPVSPAEIQYDPLLASIWDLNIKSKTLYALRSSGLDTVKQIIEKDKRTLIEEFGLNPLMLKDIDEAVRRLTSDHGCLNQALSFDFFADENRPYRSKKADTGSKELPKVDLEESLPKAITEILAERNQEGFQWTTAMTIADTLRYRYPEVAKHVTPDELRKALNGTAGIIKKDLYYQYTGGNETDNDNDVITKADEHSNRQEDDIKDEISKDNIAKPVAAETEASIDKSLVSETDEILKRRYKEKYIFTKQLLKDEYRKGFDWYTPPEICEMLSAKYAGKIHGKLYSVVCKILENASWVEASTGSTRFRWKETGSITEESKEKVNSFGSDAPLEDSLSQIENKNEIVSKEEKHEADTGIPTVQNISDTDELISKICRNRFEDGNVFSTALTIYDELEAILPDFREKIGYNELKAHLDTLEWLNFEFIGYRYIPKYDRYQKDEENEYKEVPAESGELNEIRNRTIDELNISAGLYNRMKWSGITTLGELMDMTESELITRHSFAKRLVREAVEVVKAEITGAGIELDCDIALLRSYEQSDLSGNEILAVADTEQSTSDNTEVSEEKAVRGKTDSTEYEIQSNDNADEEQNDHEQIGLLQEYRQSFNVLEAHRRDLNIKFRAYRALRLSNLETVGDIVSLNRTTISRKYPRLDTEILEEIETAILQLSSKFNYEDQIREYPFFANNAEEPETEHVSNKYAVNTDELPEEANEQKAEDSISAEEHGTSEDIEKSEAGTSEIGHDQYEIEFINWLKQERHYSEEQGADIITAMHKTAQYSKEYSYISNRLYDLDLYELEELKNRLSFDGQFLVRIQGKVNRYFSPINELKRFKESKCFTSETDSIDEEMHENNEGVHEENDGIEQINNNQNLKNDDIASDDIPGEETDVQEEPGDSYELVRRIPINNLGLSSKSLRCLQNAEVFTLGELLDLNEEELLSIKKLGYSAFYEIKFAARNALKRTGLSYDDIKSNLLNPKQGHDENTVDEPAERGETDIEPEPVTEAQDDSEEKTISDFVESENETCCDELPSDQNDASVPELEPKSFIAEETTEITEEGPEKELKNDISEEFVEPDDGSNEPEPGSLKKGIINVDEPTLERIKDISIRDIGLSNRARNVLLRGKIDTVGMLLEKTRDELMMLPNMGPGSFDEIKTCLVRLISGEMAYEEEQISGQSAEAVNKYVLDIDDERFDNIPIDELNLSVRAYNCLKNGGIETIGQLRNVTEAELSTIRGMGSGSLNEISGAVQAYAAHPTFKHTSVEEGRSFGDAYYSSEDFSNLVEKNVHDMFASAERNSMSFFDIWSGLGLTIPEQVITQEIERLVEKGTLSHSDDTYHYEFVSILDAIEVLPEKYKDVIRQKLQGKKYAEIAKEYGVTRSRIQQMAAKGMTAVIKGAKGIDPAGRVKEDDDKELFQTYDISLGEWVSDLKKPEHAYRYLAMRYMRGEKRLPGARQEEPRRKQNDGSESRTISTQRVKAEAKATGTIDDLLEYYKSLAGVQREVVLYTDEEQYVKDLTRLSKRINREIKSKKYISDIRITDGEYAMLRGYLYYAIKLLNRTGAAPDDAVFAAAVTNVAIRVYKDGNFWSYFYEEVSAKYNPVTSRNIGVKFYSILEKYDLAHVDAGGYVQNILLHCFVSDNYAYSYFEFLFNFYRIDLDRDISRLDTETMRALMDSICSEENVGRTYMLVQHIGQAMAANRRGATIRIRNHMKLLDRFFWDDSFEINTTHRLNNLMQKWARSSREVIGEMESYTTGRRRGTKRFSQPYIHFDSQNNSCSIVIPAQSVKAYDTEDIIWRITGGIEDTLHVEWMESVIGYKILETRCRIPIDSVLDEFQLELFTHEGERIKRFQIRRADIRFFDEEGYPVNANTIKTGDVTSVTTAGQVVRSSALYDSQEIAGMLISYFYFEFEDILHLPDGHVVIVGKTEITNSIAGKGRIEGASCYIDEKKYDLYGNIPYVVLRMKSQKFPGTAVTINGNRHRLSDIEYESFSINDKTDDVGYYINLHDYLGDTDDVYRIFVDIPGGASPHWEFAYLRDFEIEFDEAPYVFEPRGTVVLPEHIQVKHISGSYEKEPGVNGYKFVINDIGRTFDFTTCIGSHDARISVPVPAFFIKNEGGEWDSSVPAPVWHADLPDIIDLAVPHHKITLYMDDAFTDSSDSEREVEYRRNVGDDHILCDITKFKSYLSGDDFAKNLKMRFGDIDTNLLTIIVHSKVISLQILGDFDANDIIVNADISGKADYFVDIRKDGEIVAEKIQLINGSARLHHEIRNGIYEVEAFELVEDDSGFGGDDYYSIGIYEQEMMNPYDMTDRSFGIIQIEDRNNSQSVLPLKYNYFVLDLKKTDDNHTYNGMMVVRKRFFKGSEIASLPVSVKFEDLNKPNYVWISFVDEYGDDTDFLYDTRRQGILQEENMYLKPMVCYRRYTFLDSEEQIYHIDFIQEHYSSEYDALDEFIEFPESESKIVFKDNRYDSQRNRFELKGKEGRGNVHFSSSLIFVGDAPLSPKSKMCLRDARINTLNELTNMTKADLMGRSKIATIKIIRDIDGALAQYGMKFKDMEGDK